MSRPTKTTIKSLEKDIAHINLVLRCVGLHVNEQGDPVECPICQANKKPVVKL